MFIGSIRSKNVIALYAIKRERESNDSTRFH